MKDEFRCLIAALYGKTYAKQQDGSLGYCNCADVALRCAFYGNAQLTSKEMHKGRERDADAFEFAVRRQIKQARARRCDHCTDR
jgi:hypothetical protein